MSFLADTKVGCAIIIKHNKDVIQSSDYTVTLGPGAGEAGGKVISNTFNYKAVI